jgi:lipoprotein signal peptidase
MPQSGPRWFPRSTTPSHPARRATDREPVSGWAATLLVGLAVATIDWISKALVLLLLPEAEFVEVVPGSLAIWHLRNHAMVLGLYGELPLEIRKLIAIGTAAAGAILLVQVISCGQRLPSRQRPIAWLFAGLVLGGMLGNLGERAVHWGVTDFISLSWGGVWLPPGNFADLALFAAVPLAVLVSVLELLARTRRAPNGAPAEVMGD